MLSCCNILFLMLAVSNASVEQDHQPQERPRQRHLHLHHRRNRNQNRRLSPTSFDFRVSESKLPKALSDLTATLYDGTVYLAGGCDAENGNVYNNEAGEFLCDSISDQLYAFNYQTAAIVVLEPMPIARYRHAAVAVNGKLWILGGRRPDDDSIIGQVDVYNMADNTWKTFDLPEEYHTSDLTGFPHEGLAFFAGGYNGTYSFLHTVFAIDSEASLATWTNKGENNGNGTLVIIPKAPLIIGRGDVSSITDDSGSYALVSGGFGDVLEFCEPERAGELYDFENDSWSLVANMTRGRADEALVELNGLVFAFGGERQVEGICMLAPNDQPEPAEKTFAVDDVEVFDWKNKTWTPISDLPTHRFRFAAVGIDNISTIITFGGQLEYESSCQCFKSSSDIMLGTHSTSTACQAAVPWYIVIAVPCLILSLML